MSITAPTLSISPEKVCFPDLRAFSDDQEGNKLPTQFRPWHAIGVIRPESAPPHNLSRDVIEASIAKIGFQLWRMKK
jgi:hypothetical protein